MAFIKIGFPGLGARLKYSRLAVGASQEAIAKLVGVSRMTVYRWERGERTISEEHLRHLSRIYGQALEWFLTLDEGDLDNTDAATETARRVYRRVSQCSERHQAIAELLVNSVLVGIAAVDNSVPNS